MISFERQCEFTCHLGGMLRGLRAIQRSVQMNALASAGNRDRIVSDVAQDGSHQHRNRCTLSQAHVWSWIKIKNQTIRILRASIGAESPLRNVNLQSGKLCQPGERRKIIDHWIVIVVISVRYGPARHPIRRAGPKIFVEEDGRAFSLHLTHAVRPALAGRRPIT